MRQIVNDRFPPAVFECVQYTLKVIFDIRSHGLHSSSIQPRLCSLSAYVDLPRLIAKNSRSTIVIMMHLHSHRLAACNSGTDRRGHPPDDALGLRAVSMIPKVKYIDRSVSALLTQQITVNSCAINQSVYRTAEPRQLHWPTVIQYCQPNPSHRGFQ